MGFTNGGGFAQVKNGTNGGNGATGSTGATGPTGPTGPAGNNQGTTQNTASGAAAAQNITSTSYANLPSTMNTNVGITCPASGIITVAFTITIGINATATTTDFIAAAVVITNLTQSTTPFAASDNRSAQINGNLGAAGSAVITIGRTLTATGVGNPGDSIAVTIQARTSVASRYFVEHTDLVLIPSP